MLTALLVLSIVILGLLVFLLVLILQMRARSQLVEAWLEREILALRNAREFIPPAKTQEPQSRQPRAPSRTRPPAPPTDLTASLNEMLAGNQPYNFVEAIRALSPSLELRRFTPRAGGDRFTKEVILDDGGDGLFAWVQGTSAQLYPNYGRFSATLDPKPLFEGSRPGGRIHTILEPALLQQRADGTWTLYQRGRVQMRQGK